MAEGLTLSALFSAFTIVVRDQWYFYVFLQWFIMSISRPKWHFLRHDKELNEYKEVPKEFLQQVADEGHAFIIRYDAPLIFTSVHKFMKVFVKKNVLNFVLILGANAKCETLGSADSVQKVSPSPKWPAEHSNHWLLRFSICGLLGTVHTEEGTGINPIIIFTFQVYKEFSDQSVTVKFAAPKGWLTFGLPLSMVLFHLFKPI